MEIKAKKLGNLWYLDVPHTDFGVTCIGEKLSEKLSKYDNFDEGVLTIDIVEQNYVLIHEGLLQFNDDDLLRYFTTDDEFDIKIYISDEEYSISSSLYALLEANYKFDFHISLYRLEVIV